MLANTSQPLRFGQHEEHAHDTGAGNRERGKISYQMKNHAEIKRAGCGWGWEWGGGGREWAETTIKFKLYKFIYRTDTEIRPRTPTPVKQTNIPRTREFFFLDPRVKYYEGNPSHTNIINDVKMIFLKYDLNTQTPVNLSVIIKIICISDNGTQTLAERSYMKIPF